MITMTPKNAHDSGMSRSALYRETAAGRLDRIGRGIYLPVGTPSADWDQLEVVTRRPESTICLLSALAHYDLTDAIPRSLDIAIPRGTRAPATERAITWHHFDRATFHIGREEIPITGTEQMIGISSQERAIADCFRLRGSIGYEIPRDALKEWLRRGGKPATLMHIASQLPRTRIPVLSALEMLA